MVSGWINPESMTIRDCIALFVPLVTPPKEPGSRYDSIALVSLMTGSSQIRVLLVLLDWSIDPVPFRMTGSSQVRVLVALLELKLIQVMSE